MGIDIEINDEKWKYTIIHMGSLSSLEYSNKNETIIIWTLVFQSKKSLDALNLKTAKRFYFSVMTVS